MTALFQAFNASVLLSDNISACFSPVLKEMELNYLNGCWHLLILTVVIVNNKIVLLHQKLHQKFTNALNNDTIDKRKQFISMKCMRIFFSSFDLRDAYNYILYILIVTKGNKEA